MKKSLVFLAVAMIGLPLTGWSTTIDGIVYGAAPGTISTDPLGGAKVVLINNAGNTAEVIDSTTTNETGGFSFTNVTNGFKQIAVSLDGYVPNPSVTVFGINNDTVTVTPTIILTSLGTANVPGTSAIGGLVKNGDNAASVMVTLRRRATTTSSWVLVDSIMSDANGVFLFPDILAAGTGTTANAYSLVINDPGYAVFTSGNLTVADNTTTVTNISLTTVAIHKAPATKIQSVRLSLLGDRLSLTLPLSNMARTVQIFGFDGTLKRQVYFPAGETRMWVPAAFAHGYVFQIK